MLRFIVRKLAYLIPVLFAVTALTFLLIKLLPGDPAVNILGPSATQKAVDQIDTKTCFGFLSRCGPRRPRPLRA